MPDVLGRLRTPRLAGAPASPVVGELYYDTGTNILYYWNGTVWQSASGGGSSVGYIGTWAAGTAYTPGQVVTYNGVDYLAVASSTGQTPPAATSLIASYGTTLPATPFNGQEAVLVDSVTNPSYQWRFRYNAGSTSAYKWELVGGTPWMSSDEPVYTTTSASPTFVLLGVLAAFPTPRSGEYQVTYGAAAFNSTATAYCYSRLMVGGVSANVDIYYQVTQISGVANRTVKVTATVGNNIDLRHAVGSNTGSFQQRQLVVIPVRVA